MKQKPSKDPPKKSLPRYNQKIYIDIVDGQIREWNVKMIDDYNCLQLFSIDKKFNTKAYVIEIPKENILCYRSEY